jgi:transcriptional regulator with XRE-family HTH domain
MENEDRELTLFELLKATREKQKLTLKDISRKSRIHIKYLEAIESGNYKDIPAVYDKLFFQTYISFLDVDDKEKLMEEYRVIRGERQLPDKFNDRVNKINNGGSADSLNHIKKIYFIIPTAILIVIVLILAMYTKDADEQGAPPVKELSVKEVVAEYNKEEEAKKAAEQALKDSIAQAGKLNVDIIGLEKTWMRVIKDHKDTTEYLLKLDDKVTLSADSVMTFLIGNANGLKLSVNGKEGEKVGNKGEIITFMKVTSEGIVAKKIKQAGQSAKKEAKSDTLRNNQP